MLYHRRHTDPALTWSGEQSWRKIISRISSGSCEIEFCIPEIGTAESGSDMASKTIDTREGSQFASPQRGASNGAPVSRQAEQINDFRISFRSYAGIKTYLSVKMSTDVQRSTFNSGVRREG